MVTHAPETSNPSRRQREIFEVARAEGRVQVESLAERFDVTPQTIRRDLNQLCNLGLLRRVHGGAIASGGASNTRYAARVQLAPQGKEAIGYFVTDRTPPVGFLECCARHEVRVEIAEPGPGLAVR